MNIFKRPTREEIERREHIAAQKKQRAEAARQILEHDIFKAAVDELRRGYFELWKRTIDAEARDTIWRQHVALDAMLSNLEQTMVDGSVDDNQLENLMNME